MNRLGSRLLIPLSISSSVKDYVSSLHYSFCFTPLHLHHPLLCFCIRLHLCGLLYSTYTSRDRCSSTSTMFSSLVSFSIVCSFAKCCSTISSSSNSSMNTGSIDVALSLICSSGCQHLLVLCKNSTTNILGCIYVLNYWMRKLYVLIIHLPFYTFRRWWWMRWQP